MRQCLGCFNEFEDEYSMCPYCGYEVGTPPQEAYHMVPGSLLAKRYRIGRSIGYGGFGVTYIAYDELMKRKVAIKEYLPSEFSTRIPGQTEVTVYEGERTEQFTGGMKKFVSEAQMLAKVQRENGVVQIFDSFEGNRTAYIVMEYLKGKTLKEFLEEKGTLGIEDAKNILHPIIDALKGIHEMGIIHRDIAPDNIFLTDDGKVKLLDFGASRFATTSHSKSLSVIIKQGYAPVEQYRSRGDQGPWTDVYSLAATFYKIITGITPEDSMERLEKEELKRPSKLGVKIPRNTENALINALNLMPEKRTKSMVDFEAQLYTDGKVKSMYSKVKKADVGKWPVWAKVSVSAAALLVTVFAVLLATGLVDYSRFLPENFTLSEDQARVPNIVNEYSDNAENLLASNSLRMLIVDKQNAEFIPKGMVISQSIKKGKIVDKNGIVEVVISAGKETVVMPNVVGYTVEEATQALSYYGISFTQKEAYGEAAPGTVLSQSVDAGELVNKGDSVELTISLGYDTYIDTTQEIIVPDFVGKSFEEARKIADKNGLYIKRELSTKSTGAFNKVNEQSPKSGEKCHQGDTVIVYVREETAIMYVPDVQYKNESEAKAALEYVGMVVNCTYEENAQVAKGKVISQSVEAGKKVSEDNKNITLVVSLGTEEINTLVASWSDWGDLPADINKKEYEIEEKVQYSFRDKLTTSSMEASMPGWTQYDKVINKGEFGEWSAWSTEAPTANSDREINSKIQYSYSDLESASQEDNNIMAGWTLDVSRTTDGYKEDWGAWSEWSENAASASDSRKIETKTQYQYSDLQKKISNVRESGWNVVEENHSYSDWGAWSDWTDAAITANDYTNVETRTAYNYHYCTCPNCGSHLGWFDTQYTFEGKCREYGGGCSFGGAIPNNYTSFWDSAAPSSHFSSSSCPEGKAYSDSTAQGRAYTEGGTRTEYRQQVRTDIYEYKLEKWSDWSSWGDDVLQDSDTRQVNSRTVYRYADRPIHKTYYFTRWSDPTPYDDQVVMESSTRKVTTRTLYQYRDRGTSTKYFFYQWGEWSDYRDEKVEKTDTREVQTKTLYRYKMK